MHVRVVVALSSSLTSLACHHGAAREPAPVADPSAPLRAAAAGARALFVRHGVPYLWLDRTQGFGEPADGAPAMPACVEQDPACWKTLPADPAQVARLGAPPATIVLITPTGTCTATVGPVAVVNTSGCEPSFAYAAPLTGCGGDVAPVGFAGAELPGDLRWSTRPAVAPVDVPADPAQLADPVQRRLVTGWLAEPAFTSGPRHQTRTTRVRADAGDEALETILAAALVGADEDQCQWQIPQRETVGIRRGDQLTALALEPVWNGVLTWRGRVAAVVSGLPTEVKVTAIGPDGALSAVLAQEIWWDNEECLQESWTGVEYPCGL